MNEIDDYKQMKNQKMIRVFTELHDVNEQIKVLQAQKKILESEYKPVIEDSFKEDLFFKTPSGLRFNIKKSERKGGWNGKKIETLIEAYDMEAKYFRNEPTTVFTLRFEKGKADE